MGVQQVLIVDDDRDIVNLIGEYLSLEGYAVLTALSGQEALELLNTRAVDLVVLDLMMPRMDGFEVCRRIRESKDIPILLLSAKSTDMDKVVGLRTGADDYIVKPFSLIELAARVEAQLRRYSYMTDRHTQQQAETIHYHGLRIEEAARNVFLYDRKIKLTRTEYDILLLLVKNAGRVFSLEEIFERVWGERSLEGSASTVMVHIARLREKIEEDSRNPKVILNVWGVGYKVEKDNKHRI
ncbi:DNA-binding response regulator [Paenibacillus sp. CAA11]|uniref:response regulator transcription factor n=1 Tax=Paenibacillus sp. CAA11 TaxID=1532905 RepID=UPI000D373188|nr:response regulator transcription factor [Paenibacillus sp. CAA11]AWB46470.1 DNA-binding response regulator [Paenibacillus sp. CAA11]